MALYDQIGGNYDATRRADPEIARRLIEYLSPEPAGLYLDVACGTGNYTAALASAGLRLCGVDQSARMIAGARPKRARVRWLVADVARLPFSDGLFSGAICTLAIHHFRELGSPFGEVSRVMGRGRFVLFTAAPEQMRGYWLNEYFPAALEKSIEQMPSPERVEEALAAAGFESVRSAPYGVANDLRDLFLYSGKQRPEMYLDPRVRAGISTFAVLADPSEVRAGCEQLARDIRSGRIADVIKAYAHDRGDYLFVIAEK